jgi:hypothetical protein
MKIYTLEKYASGKSNFKQDVTRRVAATTKLTPSQSKPNLASQKENNSKLGNTEIKRDFLCPMTKPTKEQIRV